MENVSKTVSKLVKDVAAIPTDERVRQLEHAIGLAVAAYGAYSVLCTLGWAAARPSEAKDYVIESIVEAAKVLPPVQAYLAEEEAKNLGPIRTKIHGTGDSEAVTAIPAKGLPIKDIMSTLEGLRALETKMADGKATGGIYSDPYAAGSRELKEMQADVWRLYSASNALYPGLYPSVRKMEAELIRMTLDLCSAPMDGEHCGLLTSGGTESVLLATKAYRDSFPSRRSLVSRVLGSSRVEVVAGTTRHPALDKACKSFGLRLVTVPVDASTGFRMRPSDVAAAIGLNTAFVYASAPTFPHGIVDPIEELAVVCKSYGVGLHVDNCLGGILMSGMRLAGLDVPAFDFAVDGVTSMSVDVHKYGLASKGASTVLFSNQALRSATYVPVADFPGGFYVTPTLQGSRSGANMAQAWATMMHMGADGYAKMAKQIDSLVRRFATGVDGIEGLRVLVRPDCSAVAFTSDSFCVHALVERMENEHGWAFVTLQKPKAAQLCLMQAHDRSLDAMIEDLRIESKWLAAHPETKASGIAGAYAVVENLPPSVAFGTLKGYQSIALDVVPTA